jgi:hypothetical protein
MPDRPAANAQREVIAPALRKVVLPILATSAGRQIELIGTGFVVGAYGRSALMMSAVHNFDAIRRMDRPRERSHPSSPFAVDEIDFTLSRTQIWACYDDGSGAMHFPAVQKAWWMRPLDIAVCALVMPDMVPNGVKFKDRLAVCSTPAVSGTHIETIGYPIGQGRSSLEIVSAGEADFPYRAHGSMHLELRKGTVLEAFPQVGQGRKEWPCFRVSTPIDSGMSGGPVVAVIDGVPCACGVSVWDRSISVEDNSRGSGEEALAAMLWPAMLTPIEAALRGNQANAECLLDFVRLGLVDDRGKPSEHLQTVRNDDGTATILWWP